MHYIRIMQQFAATLVTCLLFATAVNAAFPAPIIKDSTGFGSKITRTMSLIATSTAQRKNTVKIQVYGQSWEKQEWSKQVATWLKATYPNVNFVFKNNAMGGFAAGELLRPSFCDIHPFYPDLLIFHVSLSNRTAWETIVSTARKNTACEMMILNGFFPIGSSSDQDAKVKDSIATKYKAERVDGWQQCRDYLTDNNLDSTALSNGHLTAQGNFVLAELVKAHFRYKASAVVDPDSLVWTYRVGSDISFTNGKLTLPFCGNRVDLIVTNPASAGSARASVLIDSKAPSTFSGSYAITRPNGEKAQDWINGPVLTDRSDSLDWPWQPGALTCVQWNKPLVIETWTARLTNINSAISKPTFSFSITGSVTGADGNGTNSTKFTSNSGRVLIETGDWFIPNTIPAGQQGAWPYRVPVANGYTVTWQVIPMFTDTFTAPSTTDPAREYAVTVAQNIPNTVHTLELTAIGTGAVPITAIRIYRPLVGRTACTVAPPKPVSIDRRTGLVHIVQPPSGLTQRTIYTLTGRIAKTSVGPSRRGAIGHGVCVQVDVCGEMSVARKNVQVR